MGTCDAACARLPDRTWVPVDVFMEELLPKAPYNTLKEFFPISYRESEWEKIAAIFKDYGIWLNHVIKVEKEKMYSAQHLWKFITLGAMVLYSNNQEGIDIVIPICHTKKAHSCDSVTAILVQVKNTEKYQTMDTSLFENTNPIKLGLFPDNVDPKPVIRMIFALATVNADVVSRKEREHDHHHPDLYTAFDVWSGGLGNNAFKHIDNDLVSYRLLLERSLRSHDTFELKGRVGGLTPRHKETRRLRESLRRRMAPLTTVNEAHHWIHSRGKVSAA